MSTSKDDVDYATLLTAVPAFFAVFSSTIVFTPKDAFLTRLSAVVALFAINYPIYLLVDALAPTKAFESALSVVVWCACASAGELVLISRVTPEDLTEGKEGASTVTLLYRASCLYFNMRRVGTKWEVKDLSYSNPESRLGFLAHKALVMGSVMLVVDALASAPPPEPHLVTKDKETLWNFGQLSGEDVIFRSITVTVMWIMSYLINYLILSSGAVFSVALGLSEPKSCPRPHNGPFSSLTSVRGLWSTFWHQILRKTLTGWGNAIADDVLCLRRGTLVSRYTRLFLAFFISGALHHVMDLVPGLPHHEFVSVVFFSLQALGIMVEDAVQAATKNWGIPHKVKSVIGFVWLWAFLWWTTPRWLYETMRNPLTGHPLPFSFFS